MRYLAAMLVVLLAFSNGDAVAYAGRWHVVENLGTRACYRVHSMSPKKGWRDFGAFNTFRMAGAWIWRHRDICRSSPALE